MTPIYAGIHADRRGEIPPSLPIWSGKCDQCQAAIIAHGPGLRRHRDYWRQQGIDLMVVCPDCATKQLEKHGGIELMEFSREVGKHFCRG